MRQMKETDQQGNELTGATPTDVIKVILKDNPLILELNFWAYCYVPLSHDERGRNPFWLTREQILRDGILGQIEGNMEESEQLAISSKVRLVSEETAHLPMMDFEIGKDEAGLTKVKTRLKQVGIANGYILESGKSYHFYGRDVLSQEQWLDFMGKCLLTSIVHTRENIEQVADPRYIGHSLRRGCNTLRVTSRGEKVFVPKVVSKI